MAECELPEDLSAGLTDEQQRCKTRKTAEFCGEFCHGCREHAAAWPARSNTPNVMALQVSRRHVAARKGQWRTAHRAIQL